MINADLQKLAEEYGMKVDQGVAYGILEGYAATFLDGTGCSRLMLTTRFDSPSQKDALMDIVNAQDLKDIYGLRKLQIAKKVIHVAFRSQPDMIEKIRTFIDWFFPLLEQFGASKADICVQCQKPIDEEDAQWILRDGATAFRMHTACADELKETVRSDKGNYRFNPDGSIVKGIAGAFLGALAGAVLWVVLGLIHFYTPIAGMAIGWLVLFGYGKLKGKTSKLRLPILIVAGVIGVLLSVFLNSFAAFVSTGIGFQAFYAFAQVLRTDLSAILAELPLGLMFFALGLFFSIKSEGRRTTDMVISDLN